MKPEHLVKFADNHHKDLGQNDKIKACCRDPKNHKRMTQADRTAECHHAAGSTDDDLYHTRCTVCGCNHYRGIAPMMTKEETLKAQMDQCAEARKILGLQPLA